MKKRLKEIEEEAGALREMQAKVEKEMGAGSGLILNIHFTGLYLICLYVHVVLPFFML